MASCRSCGAPIVWSATSTGKAMPVDKSPSSEGNVYVSKQPGGKLLATVMDAESLAVARESGIDLFTSHFATCPQSDQWRKKR